MPLPLGLVIATPQCPPPPISETHPGVKGNIKPQVGGKQAQKWIVDFALEPEEEYNLGKETSLWQE